MISLVWRTSSETVPLERFWPIPGFDAAETYRRGERGLRGKILNCSGFLLPVPIIPEDSSDAVEGAIIDFVCERREAISVLANDPGIRSEFDLMIGVGSSHAFAQIVTFSPDLLNELCHSRIFLTVTCVPAAS